MVVGLLVELAGVGGGASSAGSQLVAARKAKNMYFMELS